LARNVLLARRESVVETEEKCGNCPAALNGMVILKIVSYDGCNTLAARPLSDGRGRNAVTKERRRGASRAEQGASI